MEHLVIWCDNKSNSKWQLYLTYLPKQQKQFYIQTIGGLYNKHDDYQSTSRWPWRWKNTIWDSKVDDLNTIKLTI